MELLRGPTIAQCLRESGRMKVEQALPLAVQPVRLVMTRRDPPSLVAALVATARLELVVAVLLSIGLVTA